jgi:tRNA threonylcarbamoyladenosine biosynthesis protein TsaB
MKTLALEFSSEHRSAAVLVTASAGAPERFGSATHTCGRSTPAFALIERVLAEAGVTREEVERIALGLGPGSATGIRTAISLAQGWRLGRPVGLAGVSSLECLAARLQAEGVRGRVQVVADAQRREFHVAGYRLDAAGAQLAEPLRLAPASEVLHWIESGVRVFGPGVRTALPGAMEAYPDALTLARLGSAASVLAEGAHLDAIHLRQPAYAKAPPAASPP